MPAITLIAATARRDLVVSNRLEHQEFVRTARRYRTVQIRAGRQILAAADPLPNDLRDAIAKIDSHRRH
jgi:hypothetical protein